MNFEELKNFLKSLTVTQLKGICSNTRRWGVYSSSTAYTGYSSCKNKADLIQLIINYHARRINDIEYLENGIGKWCRKTNYSNYTYENEKIITKDLFEVYYSEIALKFQDQIRRGE